MTSDNVRHLPSSHATQALVLARAIQPGWLDRILADERRKLTPEPTPDETLERLASTGDAVRLADHHWPGGIIHGLLDQLERTQRERDQARGIAVAMEARVEAALDEVRPHIRRLTVAGGLARNVESALDPHDDDEDGAA